MTTKTAIPFTQPGRIIQDLRNVVKSVISNHQLLRMLIGRNLKIRYKKSALGFFWTLLNPLFLILVYAVFLKILRFYKDDGIFLPMMVTGIIVWQYLAMCLNDSLYTILGNASLITKVSFPRIILPTSMVLANLINFLLSLAVLVIYLLVVCAGIDFGINFRALWLLIPVIMTQTALCLGISLLLSCSNLYFRDTEHLLSVLLLAWFFLTPIIYYLTDFPQDVQRLAFLNPMCGIVTAYRYILISAPIIAPRLVLMSHLLAWLVCLLGISVFQRTQVKFADAL